MSYSEFISNKHFKIESSGFEVNPMALHLRDYQQECVRWACARGRSALFLDTGLGKTNRELEWALQVFEHTGKSVLILAPLAVGPQIEKEAHSFGYPCRFVREDVETVFPGIYVTNYESIHKFDCSKFAGVVLDESSILKGMDGKMRKTLNEEFARTPYKLSATATPSPNDFMEIGTQSEWLGIMTQTEMLATFFIHDGADTAKWRLKGHAKQKFFEWMATWCAVMRNPVDFGFNALPELPELRIHQVTIETEAKGGLFVDVAQSMGERLEARRDTVEARCKAAADIANSLHEPVLLWCGRSDGSLFFTPDAGGTPIDVWQQYASPVWMDINATRTLQYMTARDNNDERHICPLQLDVIERAMQLWTRPGDVVLSPFMGIGSEGYVALQTGRKFIGAELKESYFNVAVNNLDSMDQGVRQQSLFG